MQELDLQCLYKVSKIGGVSHYAFMTNNGAVYKVAFDLFSQEMGVYSLSVEKVAGHKEHDPNVRETIIGIGKHFFKDKERSIFYLCDILDKKQKARQRLFHRWFLSDDFHQELVKKDDVISVDNQEYYVSIIYHKNTPKSSLINDFYTQNIVELRNK